MMDLRKLQAAGCWKGHGNNQQGYNRNALNVSRQMTGFFPQSSPVTLKKQAHESVAQLYTSPLRYASSFSLAHLSSEIFIPLQNPHIRGIMVQLHLKAILDRVYSFSIASAVEPKRPDRIYIASKPHQIFLAAKHRQKPM